MAKLETFPWDAADYLQTDEDIVAYLEAALEESDAAHVARALVTIAHARGVLGEMEEALGRRARVEAGTAGQ